MPQFPRRTWDRYRGSASLGNGYSQLHLACGFSIHKITAPSEDIITKPFVYEDGTLTVPEGPGLGVEIDEDRLAQASYRYQTELDRWGHALGEDPRVPSCQFYYWYDHTDMRNEPIN